MKCIVFIIGIFLSYNCCSQQNVINDSVILKKEVTKSAIICSQSKCIACFYSLKNSLENEHVNYIVLIICDSIEFKNEIMFNLMYEIFADSNKIHFVSDKFLSSYFNVQITRSPEIILRLNDSFSYYNYYEIFDGVLVRNKFARILQK